MRSSPILFTLTQYYQLIANGEGSTEGEEFDPFPVCKLFTPEGRAIWLLTELDPAETDRAFGLCDLGFGFPELGFVSIAELSRLRTRDLRLRVERDRYFIANRPISAYAAEARATGRILA